MSSLYLFTASYPYGKIESFLEDEIHYLSREFDNIIIIPLSSRTQDMRPVPRNCKVYEPVIKSRLQQYTKGLFCFKTFPSFFVEFFRERVLFSRKRLKTWIIGLSIANNLMKSCAIKDLFSHICDDDICYFYWGKGANVLSAFYKGYARFVSRFHGEWDLWEESSGGYAPLRHRITRNLDAAAFISNKGKKYFENKYYGCSTFYFPLGSPDRGYAPRVKTTGLRVVSCSSVYPLKRVPLIFEAIKQIKEQEVFWTHIGGGEDFERLKVLVNSSCPENIKVHLLGEMSHDAVMDFYKCSQFDVFINVSENEGVPVSIMEALSFDIPVVATDVGGNSEIVTSETGLLVGANPSAKEIAESIVKVYKADCHPRSFWEKHFSAEVNYSRFAKFLKTI